MILSSPCLLTLIIHAFRARKQKIENQPRLKFYPEFNFDLVVTNIQSRGVYLLSDTGSSEKNLSALKEQGVETMIF